MTNMNTRSKNVSSPTNGDHERDRERGGGSCISKYRDVSEYEESDTFYFV